MKQLNFCDTSLLTQDPDGTLRLHGSRVTLDTFIAAYRRGDTPEQIHEGFPSLPVVDIQRAIDWYLANQIDVDDYLKDRLVEAEVTRRRSESRPGQVRLQFRA